MAPAAGLSARNSAAVPGDRVGNDRTPCHRLSGSHIRRSPMLTAYSHERAPSEEIVTPRYLLYFAIPPAITTVILSILDPMLGMTLLGVLFVMWVVLRVTLRSDLIRCQRDAVEDLVLRSRGFSWVHGDPAWPSRAQHTDPSALAEEISGHGLTDRHREGQQSQSGHRNPQDVIRSIGHETGGE